MRVCSLVEGVRVGWVPWDEVVVILIVVDWGCVLIFVVIWKDGIKEFGNSE